LIVAFVFAVGCATPNYRSLDYTTSKDRSTINRVSHDEHSGNIEFTDEVRAIKVYTKSPPEGLDVKSGSVDPTLELSGSAKSRYEIVSFFELTFPYITDFIMNNAEWWFYDYRPEENWKRYYCYPQTVLSWITLTLWNIVPLKYPCNVSRFHLYTPNSFGLDKTRREVLLNGAKAEVHRKGGAFAVLSVLSDKMAAGWVIRDRQK